jgi:hypothetical protein
VQGRTGSTVTKGMIAIISAECAIDPPPP